MRNKIWQKSILMIVPILLVLPFVNTVGAGMDAYSIKDSVITSIVVEKLQSDSQLKGSGIDVETKDGEVTLKGMVNSNADINRAVQLARSIDGVKNVDNRLQTVSSHHYGVTAPKPMCQIGANWSC